MSGRLFFVILLVSLRGGIDLPGLSGQERFRVTWDEQRTGTEGESLRGLSVVDAQVAWASGARGTILRTTDAGQHWIPTDISAEPNADFRSIHAFHADECIVASAGIPARIYKTRDGGRTWSQRYNNKRPEAFINAIGFRNAQWGAAYGDPLDGRLLVLITHDRGDSWAVADSDDLMARKGEVGFAASNSTLALGPDGQASIALSGATSQGRSRLLCTRDFGKSWKTIEVPVPASSSSGIFSFYAQDGGLGIAVGGDYQRENETRGNAVYTTDGGQTWNAPDPPPRGYRSCVARFGEQTKPLFITVGRSGVDCSEDQGATWSALANIGYHTIASAPDGLSGWAVGANGRIARLTLYQGEDR